MSDFYAHRLIIRQPVPGEENLDQMPLQAGRLTQQYIVDAYGKIESERLEWVKRNQDRLALKHYKA